MQITYLELKSQEAMNYFAELAKLRITVFRDFPYLYEGDLKYEEKYLQSSYKKPESFVALAMIGDKIVGAATAFAMRDQKLEFKEPLIAAGFDVNKICYFGESVLLKEYRGYGIGHKFMDLRLNFAKQIKAEKAFFCAVVRPEEHPLKPTGYSPLDEFWKKRGFEKTDIYCNFAWLDIDEKNETQKRLRYWYKNL